MTRYVILCPDAHKRCSDLFGGGGGNPNILCGANTRCQFPLIIWHSFLSSGWKLCETFSGFSGVGEHPEFQAT